MLPVTPLPSCMLFTFRCWQPAQEEEEEEGEEEERREKKGVSASIFARQG